uniref:Uncharacterized protein n=1 Tax=Arundo donax TaxID=35708 RepID=A0A0A9FZS0_ARUDO
MRFLYLLIWTGHWEMLANKELAPSQQDRDSFSSVGSLQTRNLVTSVLTS